MKAAQLAAVAAAMLAAGCEDRTAPAPTIPAASTAPAAALPPPPAAVSPAVQRTTAAPPPRQAAPSSPPPPVAAETGEKWITVATIAAPSAESALLQHVLLPDGAGAFTGAAKCLRALPPSVLTAADLAHLRRIDPRVAGESACKMGDDGAVRDTATGGQGVFYHVKLLGRSSTGSGLYDAGRTYGNMGADGRTYRVARTDRGWAIAQNQASWIS